MITYPVLTKEGKATSAFQVENAYVTADTVADILSTVEGVTDVKRRGVFSSSSDVHVAFKYHGIPYMVWEPYGDNSMYWIGPEEGVEGGAAPGALEAAFRRHHPPWYRSLLGNLLTLRFLGRRRVA